MTKPIKFLTPYLTLLLPLALLGGSLRVAQSQAFNPTSPTSSEDCPTVQESGSSLRQTATEDKKTRRTINHAISALDALISSYKIVKARCIPLGTPSFYLYNGANVMEGGVHAYYLLKQANESEQALDEYTNSGEGASGTSKQVAAFDAAYKVQIAAYKSADQKARWLRRVKYTRLAATGLAGIETWFGFGRCFPDSETFHEVKDKLKESKGNWEKIDRHNFNRLLTLGNLLHIPLDVKSGAVLAPLLAAAMANYVGENTPGRRVIYYGAKAILANQTQKQAEQVAACMKQRAGEYAKMADHLRAGGTSPLPDPPASPGSEPNLEEGEGPNNNTLGDLHCTKRHNGRLVFDSTCPCRDNNSCFQLPGFTTPAGQNQPFNKAVTTSPLYSAGREARDFINRAFSGGGGSASLSSRELAQKAARLGREIKALKKKINKKRVKAGKKPIDFDGESRKLAKKMQQSMGAALDRAGIKSIDQFNKIAAPLFDKSLEKLKEAEGSKGGNMAKVSLGPHGREARKNNFDFSDFDHQEKRQGQDTETREVASQKLNHGSIINDATEDIFQRISLRYQEHAYSSLFKKKKRTSP